MFNQFRRFGKHSVHIKQISTLDFEVTIDGGQPSYFQPHRPLTLFPIIEKAFNAASLQMSFEGINNEG